MKLVEVSKHTELVMIYNNLKDIIYFAVEGEENLYTKFIIDVNEAFLYSEMYNCKYLIFDQEKSGDFVSVTEDKFFKIVLKKEFLLDE